MDKRPRRTEACATEGDMGGLSVERNEDWAGCRTETWASDTGPVKGLGWNVSVGLYVRVRIHVGHPPAIEPQGDDLPLTPETGFEAGTLRGGWADAVLTETWNRSAARRSGYPSSTTQRASARQLRRQRKALGWEIDDPAPLRGLLHVT